MVTVGACWRTVTRGWGCSMFTFDRGSVTVTRGLGCSTTNLRAVLPSRVRDCSERPSVELRWDLDCWLAATSGPDCMVFLIDRADLR